MRRIQRDDAADERAEIKLPLGAEAELLGSEDDGEGKTEQNKRDRVLDPDAPAVDTLDGSQQQRFKSQLRLAYCFRKYRTGRNFFRTGVKGINPVSRQRVAFDDGIFDTDQVIKCLIHLQFGGGCTGGQRRARGVAQLDQQVDIGAAVLGVCQQGDDIALGAGEGPGDFADRRDHIRLVELASTAFVVFQVDIVVLGRRRVRNDLDAEFAAAEALGGIKIEDEGDQETQQKRHDHRQQDTDRLPAQLHHKEQDAGADQHIHQQDILPVGRAGHLLHRAGEKRIRDEERDDDGDGSADNEQHVLAQGGERPSADIALLPLSRGAHACRSISSAGCRSAPSI